MRLLYFSPRPFGMMGTPGTYQLVETLSQFVETLVVCNAQKNTNFVSVHQSKTSLNIKELFIGSKGYLRDFKEILSEYRPSVVVIANYAKWYDVASTVKDFSKTTKIILDIKSPLITQDNGHFQLLNSVQLNSQIHEHLLDLVMSRCDEDIESWIPGYSGTRKIYPLGLDISKFTPKKKEITALPEKKLLKMVFIGSYAKNRKLDELLKIIAELPVELKRKISVDMYGSGPYKEMLVEHITVLGLEQQVNIYDALEQKELFSKLSDYDVGLGWVPKEIFDAAPSLKSLEYIASGLIPLLTATKGHIRDLTDGFNAILFDENSRSLETALQKIMKGALHQTFIDENLALIERRDWNLIAKEHFMPAFESLFYTKVEQREDSNCEQKKVQYESHWSFPCHPFISSKEKTYANIKTLCITSERLYYGLKEEIDYYTLSEERWKEDMANINPSMLLIETCFESVSRSWHHSMVGSVSDTLASAIRYAKEKKIPVVVWCSVDYEYIELFAELLKMADCVGYADEQYASFCQDENICAFSLPPAVQPRLFNPLRVLTDDKPTENIDILVQSLLGIQNNIENVRDAKEYKIVSFERLKVPTRNQLREANMLSKHLKSYGKLSYRLLPEALKRSLSIVIDAKGQTQTELKWQMMENSACRVATYFTIEEAIEGLRDSFLREVKVVRQWRDIYDHHTYKHRIDTIFEHIGLYGEIQKEDMKITVITPTKRVENFDLIIQNYEKQKVKNKELVIVVNGEREQYVNFKKKIAGRDDVKVLFLPTEEKAATALNLGVASASGEYVFRFDDDDCYGEEYIADALRFLKIDNASVVGKFGSYVKIVEEQAVYKRKNSSDEKKLVSFCAENFPLKNAAISGATFGVRKSLLEQFPFPNESLRTADSAWLEQIRLNAPNRRCLKTDFFQFTISRKLADHDHTWKTDMNSFIDRSVKIDEDISEVPR